MNKYGLRNNNPGTGKFLSRPNFLMLVLREADEENNYEKEIMQYYFLCSLVSIMLCACNNSADGITETATFQATVIEATNNSILVEPIEGSQELSSSDRFRIPNKDGLELQTGLRIMGIFRKAKRH